MSSALDDSLAQANQLVAAGDLAAAQELLDDVLSAADPSPARAAPELADAAALQARVLMTLGEPHPARGWAAFAYSATTRLYGPSDPRTVAAAATLAAVLHRVGSHARAGRLYREVIIELTATDGPESLRVLAAHADLATVEYARGECQVARDRLQDAWELHREVYGDGHSSGIKMLARLGAMQRDCGLLAEGYENLALAQELCRQHLPADHPLCAQIAGLAEASPDSRHVCAAVPEWARQSADPPPQSSAPADPPLQSSAPADPPLPPGVPGFVTATSGREEPAGPGSFGYPPDEPPYAADDEPPAGPPYPYPHDEYRDDEYAPGYPEDEPPYSAAEPPSVSEESDGVWRTSALPARREPARLPVPVPQQPRAPQRRLTPAVVVGLLAALIGAIIVVAGFSLAAQPEADPPSGNAPPPASPSNPTPTTTSPAPVPAAPGAPPTEVRLRDGRDRVTLTWTYPPGAEGPVVISGGRAGQELRAFYELPAGTTSYIVYNLDPNTNFCFSVAVIYSVDTVGRAEPVCTLRPKASGNG